MRIIDIEKQLPSMAFDMRLEAALSLDILTEEGITKEQTFCAYT
jgi:hypothetical protein